MAGPAPSAALGFRVRSGRAVAVLLGGTGAGPQLLDRREIALCDPDLPETRQPYHARMGALETDPAVIAGRVEIVRRAARASVEALLRDYRRLADDDIAGAGLVVGSLTPPEQIRNQHMRAHAHEGALFPTALQEALEASGVRCRLFLDRHVYGQAAAALHVTEEKLRSRVAELGRSRTGPWRADEKLAAAAAWAVITNCDIEARLE